MRDLTPRERVFRAMDSGDDVEFSRELDNYRDSLISALTDIFKEDVNKGKLVGLLRDMDRATTKGDAECAWYYWRNSVEDALEIPRGILDTGPYEEEDEE